MEADLNNLRVVESDEKETPCLGLYYWAILSLSDINTPTRCSRLGIERKADDLAVWKIYR
jgi:hypothetical protein